MSYESKVPKVHAQQLKVQELTVRYADAGLYTASVSGILVDLGEGTPVVYSCIFIDNSAVTSAPIAAANMSVSGTIVNIGLTAPFATSDVVILKYSV